MISSKRERNNTTPLHKKLSLLEEKGLDFGEGQLSTGGGEGGRGEGGDSLLFLDLWT